MKEDSPTQKAEVQDISVQKSYKCVIKTRELSGKLSQNLSETVNACDKFCLRYAVDFQDLSADGRRSRRSLFAIQTTFYELELLKDRLESMAKRCDNFTRNVSPSSLRRYNGLSYCSRTVTDKLIATYSLIFFLI